MCPLERKIGYLDSLSIVDSTEVSVTLMRGSSDNVYQHSLSSTRQGYRYRTSNYDDADERIGVQDSPERGASQSSVTWGGLMENRAGDISSDHEGEESFCQDGQENLRTGHLSNMLPRLTTIGRRSSFIEDGEPPPAKEPLPTKQKPVAWKDLPHKGQLAILTIARLSEPLTQTSLQAYMFYQLKSFDPSLADSAIATQAGLLQGSFTAAQFVTAILWGRVADSDWGGRKMVLLIGLLGTCLSCVGFGFSRSFLQAAIFRTLGGALNGNVGVMRTMVAEIVREKK